MTEPDALRGEQAHKKTEPLRRGVELICALVLFTLMVRTATDVAGRGLFNSPALGSFQITQLLLAVMIFTGLPLVTTNDEHLRAGLLEHVSPPHA